MVIDDKTYKLSHNNYIPIETEKTQIIIGNTFNHDMRHVIGWLNRYNGKYKKTAPYSISYDGTIYKHFEPKYFSKYFNDSDLNNKSIVILLENDGFLLKDKKNEFITWTGDIYKQQNDVFERKWRGYEYWAPYTEEQISSLVELVCMLCDRFKIPLVALGHNTKISQLLDFKGLLYKGNLEKYYTDPNPNLNYELIKNKIESYERKY
jgi:N-acetyl-anhydromuramyl-L-alanine amidase AmpD